ncbi:transferrin-binding protein-like solute binding protein [Roseibaca sp. V10]|uniref:Transferrin-binding protein-like solute binding protein n=1 Tax=Roseinatronobacter domitianus TaxID=2940293 RepID=A0ABT0LZY9_9RHOB|nr:transferrin-binding protein-like solute binding protein [Roseibaca domitiana]MCL1628184.1 transferrin-binding protein-like solute binding protein [Roseibaca domitiana]
MLIRVASALSVVTLLSACSGGALSPTSGSVSTTSGNMPNVLAQSGQGNSGGVVANGPPASGIEATMRYNGVSGRGSGARIDFHNGDLTGVAITCTRAGGGATVPECDVVNADSAWLVNELSGRYAYAGGFAVNGHGPDADQDSFVTIHSGPGQQADESVVLPGESVEYRGRFQAGASLIQGGVQYDGRATGSVDLTADFTSGTLSAEFQGLLRDDTDNSYADLAAGFEGALIGPDGRFYNSDGTVLSYNGTQAWGELDGAFYGPNAEEVAGTFGFGNASGGMTGILLGCSEYTLTNCVAPSPGF